MTVLQSDRRKEYPGNDVATVFTGPRAFSASHITVYSVDDDTLVATLLTSGYTLTGVGATNTSVQMAVAPASGTTLRILRTVPYEQACDISNQGAYLPETLEDGGLDPLSMQIQQLADDISGLDLGATESLVQVFVESGETTNYARRIDDSAIGAHGTTSVSGRYIGIRPLGSGVNGPVTSDVGLTVSALKQAFDSTGAVGEVDGISIAVRNGGAASDSCAILGNVATYGSGYMAFAEGVTSIIVGDTITASVRIQIGVTDNVTPQYFGYLARAEVGTLDIAYLADTAVASSWAYLFVGQANGVDKIKIDGSGHIKLFDAAGLTKTLRASSGALSVMDNAGTLELFNLSDTGALDVKGNLSAPALVAKGAASGVAAGQVAYGGTTATSATAGANGDVPAQVAGYIIVNVAGTARKVPFYAT